MDYSIDIEQIDLNDVLQYDKEKYNSNNHWIDNKRPNDYEKVLEKSNTHYWIDNFKTYKKFTMNIDSWLIEAMNLCKLTGKFSNLYEDEINDYLFHNSQFDKLFDKDYFVRTENVSLKYSQHKCGPYTNLRQLIESLITCISGHSPIEQDTKQINVYLIPWQIIDEDKEFRVFIYKNNITAISQQNSYKKNQFLNNSNSINIIKHWITIIHNYFHNVIKHNITHLQNYVIDIAILDNNESYFIEINSFGKEYASGSALFHWLLDKHKLYNEENIIYFRYV